MRYPPWFDVVSDALGISRWDRDSSYQQLNAKLGEVGRKIARDRYLQLGYRTCRAALEKEGGWDCCLEKTTLPIPLTLPDRIHLSVRVDPTSITRNRKECLVIVLAEGGADWKETFTVPLILGEWLIAKVPY